MRFGPVLKKYRAVLHLCQEDVAQAQDCNVDYVSQLERDLRKPSLEWLQKFASLVGRKMWEIVKEAEEL